MNKILTFSIAAYNVEQYLENTINTILDANRNDDIEVLIVNDGSKDKTKEIAQKLQEEYPNTIRLIDKENGGHGSTINTGMRNATGKYFRALDGDDWVNANDLAILVDQLKTCDADMVIHNFDKCYEDGRIEKVIQKNLENEEMSSFENICEKTGYITYHMVIFKTNILNDNNIQLDEHCFYVDSEYVLFPIPYIQTVQYFDLSIYCYRLGLEGQSVSNKSRMKHVGNSETVANKLIQFYENLPKDLPTIKRQYILDGCARHCTWHFMTLLLFKDGKENLKKFDDNLYQSSIDIYKEMENEEHGKTKVLAIKQLRKSKYMLFKIFHSTFNRMH